MLAWSKLSSLLLSFSFASGVAHNRQMVSVDLFDQPADPEDEMPIVSAVADVPGGQCTTSSERL